MSKKDNIDFTEYQVIVDRPIWLGGRIWEPGIYNDPPAILLNCAKEVFGDEDSVLHFAVNGVKTNPFAKFTMVDLTPPKPEYTEENEADGLVDTEDEEVYDEDEVAEDEDVADEDEESDVVEDGDAYGFITPEEFSALSKTKQSEYIESIREVPEEADTEDYEKTLYYVLSEYAKVATGTKALNTIEEILAEYSE